MSKQIISIGASANDGTGDPLRNAFDKTNDNFNELLNIYCIMAKNMISIYKYDYIYLNQSFK